jgi:hypothetical protein
MFLLLSLALHSTVDFGLLKSPSIFSYVTKSSHLLCKCLHLQIIDDLRHTIDLLIYFIIFNTFAAIYLNTQG